MRHDFEALAFAENLSLRDLAVPWREAKRSPHELRMRHGTHGEIFFYPFGAIVFQNVPNEQRGEVLERLSSLSPGLGRPVVTEELRVLEDASSSGDVVDGVLTIDRLTLERTAVIAQVVAQSAAMEYYEGIIQTMFASTDSLVDRLERSGSVAFRTRPLHRFIGTAVGTRSEVLAVLHLLDKPDGTWDDPRMDQIYEELRREFDLGDRFAALELKLRSIQEALELVLDVARDRRLVLLETTVVVLIVLEILVGLIR